MSTETANKELMREIVHAYPKIVVGDMEVLHRFLHHGLKDPHAPECTITRRRARKGS
jgi:hypothetical protein